MTKEAWAVSIAYKQWGEWTRQSGKEQERTLETEWASFLEQAPIALNCDDSHRQANGSAGVEVGRVGRHFRMNY